jgi:hypothetical protein
MLRVSSCRGFAGRILLASNGAFSPDELTGLMDKVVDKNRKYLPKYAFEHLQCCSQARIIKSTVFYIVLQNTPE